MLLNYGLTGVNFKAFQKLGLLETDQNPIHEAKLKSQGSTPDSNKYKFFSPEEKKDYLYFKTLSGKIVKVDKAVLSGHSTIDELKNQIAEQLHLEKDMSVKIITAGKQIDDVNEILLHPGNDESDPFYVVSYRVDMSSQPNIKG